MSNCESFWNESYSCLGVRLFILCMPRFLEENSSYDVKDIEADNFCYRYIKQEVFC